MNWAGFLTGQKRFLNFAPKQPQHKKNDKNDDLNG